MATTRAETIAARPAPEPKRVFRTISHLFLESIPTGYPAAAADVYIGEVEAAYLPAVEAGMVEMPVVVLRHRAATEAFGAFPNPDPPVDWNAALLTGSLHREAMLDRAALLLFGDATNGRPTTGALDWMLGERDRLFRDWAAGEIRRKAMGLMHVMATLREPVGLEALVAAMAERVERILPLLDTAGDEVQNDPATWMRLSKPQQDALWAMYEVGQELALLTAVGDELVRLFGVEKIGDLLRSQPGDSAAVKAAGLARAVEARTAAVEPGSDEPGEAMLPEPIPAPDPIPAPNPMWQRGDPLWQGNKDAAGW